MKWMSASRTDLYVYLDVAHASVCRMIANGVKCRELLCKCYVNAMSIVQFKIVSFPIDIVLALSVMIVDVVMALHKDKGTCKSIALLLRSLK